MNESIVQLTRVGTVFRGNSEDLKRLRARFDREHYIRMRALIEPKILEQVFERISRAEFNPSEHEGIGKELCLQDSSALFTLQFLVNNRQLFQIIESVTGCGGIGCFGGRVYRFAPGLDHYDSWHSDLTEGRIVAMSINLTREPYDGGILQLRDSKSDRIREITNTIPGDAILFRIAPEFKHRLTDIRGVVAKTAFAGWFKSTPDFLAELRTTAGTPL